LLGGIAQCLSQPVHGGTDAVLEFDNRVVRPKALAKFFSSHHMARPFEQRLQYSKWLVWQPDGFASLGLQLARAKIKPKTCEVNRNREPGGYLHAWPRFLCILRLTQRQGSTFH
jgi:hypothetical protein